MSEHADPIPPVEVEAPEVPPEDRVSRLDPETRARRDAALRLVRKYGDPSLKSRALPWSASTTRCARRCGGWAS